MRSQICSTSAILGRPPRLTDREHVWSIIAALLSDEEAGRSGPLGGGHDYVHHSTNSTLGKSTIAAIGAGLWEGRATRAPSGEPRGSPPELRSALERLLEEESLEFGVARAAIGMHLYSERPRRFTGGAALNGVCERRNGDRFGPQRPRRRDHPGRRRALRDRVRGAGHRRRRRALGGTDAAGLRA